LLSEFISISVLPLFILASFATNLDGNPTVKTMRAPDDRLQPKVTQDPSGTFHLLYYKGAEDAGNIFYCSNKPDSQGFGKALRVNNREASE
jgi:hypothetical protein